MAKDNSAASGGQPRRSNGADPMGVNSEIGRKLKQYYDGLVAEEIPDRFAQLLTQLEKVETSQKKG
jgi:hypothetical protein